MIDGLLVEVNRIEQGARGAASTRRRSSICRPTSPATGASSAAVSRQPDRSRQADYEVRIDLSDPAERAEVLRWFEAESTELLGMPLGEHLRTRMLEQLAGLDEIVLQRSPRSAGRDIADTERDAAAGAGVDRCGSLPARLRHRVPRRPPRAGRLAAECRRARLAGRPRARAVGRRRGRTRQLPPAAPRPPHHQVRDLATLPAPLPRTADGDRPAGRHPRARRPRRDAPNRNPKPSNR